MGSNKVRLSKTSSIFVGVDVHSSSWQVTVRSREMILKRASLPSNWDSLRKLLSRWPASEVAIVYEAGFSGFWLYDEVVNWGGVCVVLPPSRIPMESGNRIKTDRRDSAKLAELAVNQELPCVWVPSPQQRQDREAVRERRRMMRQKRQVQCQIKALLHCYGLQVPSRAGRWSQTYVTRLWQLRFASRYMEVSFRRLLERYEFLREQIAQQTKLIRELADSEIYREQVTWLSSLPGVGKFTAIELLLELGDIERFDKSEQLAAYVGLTPGEYSSGGFVRRGHISRCGRGAVRGRLVEAGWIAIRFDQELREVYERIRVRGGGKKAIVAVARRLLLRARRLVIDGRCYKPATAA